MKKPNVTITNDAHADFIRDSIARVERPAHKAPFATPATVLYAAYRVWCAQRGVRVGSAKFLAQMMARHGYHAVNGGRVRVYLDVRLRLGADAEREREREAMSAALNDGTNTLFSVAKQLAQLSELLAAASLPVGADTARVWSAVCNQTAARMTEAGNKMDGMPAGTDVATRERAKLLMRDAVARLGGINPRRGAENQF